MAAKTNYARNNYFRGIIFILILTTFLPIVFTRLPAFIGSFHLWYAIFLCSLIIFTPKVFKNKLFLITISFSLFVLVCIKFIWVGAVEWNKNFVLIDMYNTLIGVSIYTYFVVNRDFKGMAYLSLFTVVSLVITSVLSIYAISQFDTINRLLIYNDDEVLRIFHTYGAGSSVMLIVLMSIFSPLIYYYQNIKFINCRKFYIVFIVVLFLYTLIQFQVFTNLLIAFCVVIFSIISINNRKRFIFIATPIAVILMFIPNEMYSTFILSIGELFTDIQTEISYKFKDLATYIVMDEVSVDSSNAVVSRAARLPVLIDSFFEYPFWGCSTDKSYALFVYNSGASHLGLMNKLGSFGLIYTLFNIYIYIHYVKKQRELLDSQYYYYFLIAVLAIILHSLPKVTSGRETWIFFFVILPGLYYLPLVIPNKKTNIQL